MAHISVKDEPATPGPSIVKDLFLVYGTDEKMAAAIWEEWQHDPNNPGDPNNPTWPWPANFYPNPNDPNNTHKVAAAAAEFRYESGRRRHLLRYWHTDGKNDKEQWTPGETLWTDYLGNEPYVDYTVANVGGAPVATDVTRFLAGLGIHGREGLGEGGEIPRFMHGDLIGSTMMETGPTGEVASSGGWEDSLLWQYTAFGEPIWPWPEVGIQRTVSSGRYKYAGSYGYEWGMIHLWGANEDLPPILLLHVGERWYQPGVGRFVQRDPIGTGGGLNVYAYCNADALSRTDALGLRTFGDHGEYWTRKTPEQAYTDLTGGNSSWMDDPRKVRKVQFCIDVGATLVTWLAPQIGVVREVVRIGGRTITVVKWIINGVEVWWESE